MLDGRPTVYFDGACPLCRREIAFYRGRRGADGVRWVDVSAADAALPDGLTRAAALARFHVVDGDGRLLSGARAFAALWRALPDFRLFGRVVGLPGVVHLTEVGYRGFLKVRPWMTRRRGGRCAVGP